MKVIIIVIAVVNELGKLRQILKETVCISFCTNAFVKGMNLFLPSPNYG